MKVVRPIACLLLVWAIASADGFAVASLSGQVTFAGLPVPGATVTAIEGDKEIVSTTDPDGVYRLADLADGVWTIKVEMRGFETISRDITMPSDAPPAFQLTLLGFDEIARGIPVQAPSPASPTP